MTFKELNKDYFRNNALEIGQQIKRILNERNEQIKEITAFLHCSNTHFSRKLNNYDGVYFSKEDIELLAIHWNIRKEYLSLLDKWKTENDFENDLNLRFEFGNTLLYLKSLGFTISPVVYWRGKEKNLIEVYESLKPFLNHNSIKYIKEQYNDFINYDNSLLTSKYIILQLNNSPSEHLTDFSLLKKDYNSLNKTNYLIYDGKYKGFIELSFNVSTKGNTRNINIQELYNMLKLIDETNKTIINNFITCYGSNN